MKALAAELDWSPSELSMRTTLGGDSSRPFPVDDDHLVRLMRLTKDHSVLYTLAEMLGYELRPKASRTAELLAEVQQEVRQLAPKMQMVLELGGEVAPAKGKAKR